MARGLNKVMLIGRLGADPEIRYTADGTPVATFRIATDSPIKRGEQWETETEWHRIVAWRRLAEVANQYLSKGSLVYVEGRLKTRAWEDRDGNKRWTTEVVARDLQMLDTRGGSGGYDADADLAPPDAQAEVPVDDEDDVPF